MRGNGNGSGNGNGNRKLPVLVVVQQSGGNDFMNTLVPYTSGVYYDSRPAVRIPEDKVLPINDALGFHPQAALFKEMYDAGNVAIIQGIGYRDSNRSHFRGMDIMHTCEPDRLVYEGWLGKAIRDLDPKGENVLTGVNFGRGLPRAMAAKDVPVTSIGDLDSYGLMTPIAEETQRKEAMGGSRRCMPRPSGLARCWTTFDRRSSTSWEAPMSSRMCPVSTHPKWSTRRTPSLRVCGTSRVCIWQAWGHGYSTSIHGGTRGYDTHANELPTHATLLTDLSAAIMDFFHDLRDHDASEQVVMLVFTEFGRRIQDNGTGTDHGSGGGAFLIGDRVEGGLYAEYPPLDPSQWERGEDLKHTIDFRGVYGTLIEQWMGLDPVPIVSGTFEQISPFK